MCSETHTLGLQLVAAFLMGFDYLFNERLLGWIEKRVRAGVSGLQASIDGDIRDRADLVVQKAQTLVVSVLFLLLGFFVLGLMKYLPGWSAPWSAGIVAFVALMLFSGGILLILTIGMAAVVPIAVAVVPRAITTFVLYCPKGSVFGIGFILLLLTFACRWSRLT